MKLKESLGGAWKDVWRVLKVARRPGRKEFTLMLKVCSLGLLILGVYGFIILYVSFIFLASGAP